MKYKISCILLAVVFLTGCGSRGETPETNAAAPSTQVVEEGTVPATGFQQEKHGSYKAPPLKEAVFHEETGMVDGVRLDLSAVAEGYVAVSATSDSRLKFQVLKDEETYNYDIASDGTPSVFPLQCGDGSYTFRVVENVEGTTYIKKYETSEDVTLQDEFQPFLRPSDYVNYTADSQCVKKAQELAEQSDTALELVGEVFDYICAEVVYDKEKATNVKTNYLPDPDETLETGKGICFDYASLTAAMLRSQGIPTKVIFGYVSPNDLYHAWNMFYTEETGWVTVDFEVSQDSWNRLDLTFSANGADETFIGNGGNYSDVYVY